MIHVYPVDEAHRHELEGTCCPCGVSVDWTEATPIVTHRRFEDVTHDLPRRGMGRVAPQPGRHGAASKEAEPR